MYRTERDTLGEIQIPSDALYGINAARARENFRVDNSPFPVEWYTAVGITKLACYKTYRKFRDAAIAKKGKDLPIRVIDDGILDALTESAEEVAEGKYFDHFVVPAMQGGAGTSINMNINEIIANLSLIKTGKKPGDYSFIDPTEDANIYQSTNDVIPSALTVAVMRLLSVLEESINNLRQITEELERKNRKKLRPGYTQMQEAVPSSFGLLFGAYNEALSRDWWRVSKCHERIKQINLGGGATGTGMAIPRFFIMEVVPELRTLTGFQLSHSENLADTTSNLDKWVEIHAILKAHAVNIEKMVSDIRLLASDISAGKTVIIPQKQVGSSIMPGKINPVIPEFVISAAQRIYSNDVLISSLSARGNLELNAYLPLIGSALIESLNLLVASDRTMFNNLFNGLRINEAAAYNALLKSPSVTTALIPYIGYHNAGRLANEMKENESDIIEANLKLKLVNPETIKSILEPGNLLKLGFSLDEIC